MDRIENYLRKKNNYLESIIHKTLGIVIVNHNIRIICIRMFIHFFFQHTILLILIKYFEKM